MISVTKVRLIYYVYNRMNMLCSKIGVCKSHPLGGFLGAKALWRVDEIDFSRGACH